MTIPIVRLTCRRLNASAGPALREAMQAVWASHASVIALDFSEVVSIDSLGVSVLIAEARAAGTGRILLCSLNDYVREVLEITQLVRLFAIYRDADAVRLAAG